jgi:hypothetical protein
MYFYLSVPVSRWQAEKLFARQWFDILFSKSVNLRQVEDPKLVAGGRTAWNRLKRDGRRKGSSAQRVKAFWVSGFLSGQNRADDLNEMGVYQIVLITDFKIKERLALVQKIGQASMGPAEVRIHFALDNFT